MEEKEAKIRELKQLIETQNKMLNEVTLSNQNLQGEKEKLQQTLEEKQQSEKELLEQVQNVKEESQVKEEEKAKEEDNTLQVLKKDYYKLEDNFKEIKTAKEKIYKELVHSREKVDSQEKEIHEKDNKITEFERKIGTLEKTVQLGKQQLNQVLSGMPLQPLNMMGGYMGEDSMIK